MTVLLFVLSFFFATAVSYTLTPFVRKITLHFKVMDIPGERNPHGKAKPTMGGIAMFISFFVVALIANLGHYAWRGQWVVENTTIFHLLVGSTLVVAIGIIDDKYRINYKLKLAGEVVVALLMVSFGYRIFAITSPFNGQAVHLGWLVIPVTILWYLFIVNAINLIDGIDGLAAGISLIALGTIFLVATYLKNIEVRFFTAILAGSVTGFFRYNFSPASIFMGDTGSLFLGFLLAILSLKGAQKSSTAVALATPIVILGLPILDSTLAVVRRWSSEWASSRSLTERFFSWKRIFYPDLGHIHHKLLALGLSKPQTAILLYLIAFSFGIMGFVLTAARYQEIALVLLYMGLVFFLALRKFSELPGLFSKSLFPRDKLPLEHMVVEEVPSAIKEVRRARRKHFNKLVRWAIGALIPLIAFVGFLTGKVLLK